MNVVDLNRKYSPATLERYPICVLLMNQTTPRLSTANDLMDPTPGTGIVSQRLLSNDTTAKQHSTPNIVRYR